MSLKIRLARGGAKQRPFYRIVVANVRSPRDGRYIEKVGTYNPMLASDHPDRLLLNEARIQYWLGVGAEPTDRLARFFGARNLMSLPAASNNPEKAQPKKKAQERMKKQAAAVEAAKKAAEDAKKVSEAVEAAPVEIEAPVEEKPAMPAAEEEISVEAPAPAEEEKPAVPVAE